MINSVERGRPSNFAKEEVIKKVTELFWTHGYNSLSLNNIAKEIGLNRSSLYNTFETKEALFLNCLEYYTSRSPTNLLKNCKPDQKIRPLLYKVFDEICKLCFEDKRKRGCFAENAYSELAASKTTLSWALIDRQRDRKNNMVSIVSQAIKQKELPKDTNPEITANIILSFMSGLNIHVKEGVSKTELQQTCKYFLIKIGFQELKSL